jgi:hypothetical protein
MPAHHTLEGLALGYSIPFVPLPGLYYGLRLALPVLAQRAAHIVAFLKLAFRVSPDVPLIARQSDQFARGCLLFGDGFLGFSVRGRSCFSLCDSAKYPAQNSA